MAYSDYTTRHMRQINSTSFDTAWDWEGPQFWFGTQCLKTFDWHRPRTASPIIGVIGNSTNITESIGDYYFGMYKM